MVSVADCAKASEHVYSASNHNQPDGWNRVHQSPGPVYRLEWGSNSQHKIRVDSGFFGAIYKNRAGQFIVAYRGTEITDPGDISADVAIGRSAIGLIERLIGTADFKHRQIEDAARLLSHAAKELSVSDRNCVVTGHSLGGALAKVVAANQGYRVVAFNAPGVKQDIGNRKFLGRITNVRTRGDVVSRVGDQEGEPMWVDLPLKSTVVGKYGRQIDVGQGVFGQHSMSNLLAEIRKDSSRFAKPLL